MTDADTVAPPATLVVVATPIGNLGDLSERAGRALQTADLVCCEDTRRTGRLLEHLGVRRPLMRLDAHVERAGAGRVIEVLGAGGRVALVGDAGTPAVSDPGARLVAEVVRAGFEVRAVPGPSAVLAAIVVSGLPADRFVFEGFLPRRGADRRDRLADLAVERRTSVVFESPHRLADTLAELSATCGPTRQVAVCRELTKVHERVWRGPLSAAADAPGSERGEVVIVLGGAEAPAGADDDVVRGALEAALATGSSRRDAVRDVARRLGVARNRVYALAAPERSDTG